MTAQLASTMRQEMLFLGRRKKLLGICAESTTLVHAWERYREEWLEARGKASLRTDSASFDRHIAGTTLAAMHLTAIRERDLESMSRSLFQKGLSSQTVKHVLGLIRRVMNKALVWKMWNGPSPFAHFQMPRVDNQRRRYLREEELSRLLEALSLRSRKVWLMSLVSLQCGLRFGEIARLRKADVDCELQHILVRQSKNGKSRYAVMPDSLNRHLAAWCRNLTESDLLFPTAGGKVMRNKCPVFNRVVDELGLNANLADSRDKFVFHSLRHTYASYLARNGCAQALIAELLGHSSLEMTKRYVHLMPETRQEAARIMEGVLNAGGPRR